MTEIPSFIWNFLSGLPLIPSSKMAAESWLSRGELGLVIFGAVIIIGIVGESCADIRSEHRERSWVPPLPGRKHWNWKLIFAGVVVLSIIGEFISDADIWVSSDALQTISDGELIALQKRLQQYLEPRKLNQEQKDRIARAIELFRPIPFVIMTTADEEPWEFAIDIAAVLRANGWNWQPFPENSGYIVLRSPYGWPNAGMTVANRIEIHAPPEQYGIAQALANALTDPNVIGMENTLFVPKATANIMTVIVGSKR